MADPASWSADDLESRLAFETLISAASAELIAAPPEQLPALIQTALERVRTFFGADRCALLSVSSDHQLVRVRFESSTEGVQPVSTQINLADLFPWSRETLIDKRAPVRIARMADLPPEAEVERRGWEQLSIRSALTLPIETGEGNLHLIVLNTMHIERDWPDAFVSRLRVFGELIVSAIERGDLLAGLIQTQARLSAGADLAGLGFYEVDFLAGAVFVDENFREVCGIPVGSVQGLGIIETWKDRLHPEDQARILEVRRQLHEGEAEQVSAEYRLEHPHRGTRWIRHIARVAQRDDDGRGVMTYGVLRDITRSKQAEGDLQKLSQRLIRAQEAERALIARELHDDLTQRLAVLAIDVGRAESQARDATQAHAMQAVREGLGRLSEDVQALAYRLHPAVLEELGLVEALRAECELSVRLGGPIPTVELAEEAEPDDRETALCLFRVAQEALHNVLRHAMARSVSVVLRPLDGGLVLAVKDDGVGFDAAARRRAPSLGLASMRERVSLVRGTLDVESAPGEGTAVVAWVPNGGESK